MKSKFTIICKLNESGTVSSAPLTHDNDVIMSSMAPRITSLTIVYSTFFTRRSTKTLKFRVTGLCVRTFTGDRWILRKKGQWRKKCSHLMTSSWEYLYSNKVRIPESWYFPGILYLMVVVRGDWVSVLEKILIVNVIGAHFYLQLNADWLVACVRIPRVQLLSLFVSWYWLPRSQCSNKRFDNTHTRIHGGNWYTWPRQRVSWFFFLSKVFNR